ncbi:Succinyl-CoA ligase [ADP-forming] subunit beta [Chlamydiales bacterium STE3]|nr:Succinyl-CoA ligase [ADP-forming] subunit beta [Chlamydiales bacterium STE3]
MHLHEYQAKEILQKYEIPSPEFVVISSMEELQTAIDALQLSAAVLKVQIHAGGRGKAGGVKIAQNRDEIQFFAEELLGKYIKTKQTGAQGILVRQILLSPLMDIEKEYYLAATIDRKMGKAVLIASREGGVEIEEVAAQSPEKILKMEIPLCGGMRRYHLLEVAKFLRWEKEIAEQGQLICKNLAKAFLDLDAELIEINPLILTSEQELTALDTKLSIDDNALFRHPDLLNCRDLSQIPALEAAAIEQELAYVSMEGEIGCMVNGAGLAMATLDIIHHYGGRPANFLDVGGSATEDKVAEGFKIILKDQRVKAVLVNIFGGIMNCETLAAGLISAIQYSTSAIPIVVRMEGTNVEKGKQMLADAGLSIEVMASLTEAAQKAVQLAKE